MLFFGKIDTLRISKESHSCKARVAVCVKSPSVVELSLDLTLQKHGTRKLCMITQEEHRLYPSGPQPEHSLNK